MSIKRIEDKFLNTTIRVYRPIETKNQRGGIETTNVILYDGLKARIADTYKRRFVFAEEKEGINKVNFLVGSIKPVLDDGRNVVVKENDRIFDYNTKVLYKITDTRLILNKFGGIHKIKVNLEAIRKTDFISQTITVTAKARVV